MAARIPQTRAHAALIAALAAAAAGCGRTAPAVVAAPAPGGGGLSSSSSAGTFALAFLTDDYPRARADAAAAGRLLFVDAWAPWCHTCLSLRSYVFTDPALGAFRDRFVWLALDTERAGNAAFLAAHPVEAWPTLFVIDPRTEAVRALWRGALKVDELVAWLSEASGAAASPGSRERAAEARVGDLRRHKDNPTCVDDAESSLRWMAAGTSRLNVALEGLTCAQRLPGSSPRRGPASAALAEAILGMVEDARFALLPDDRSNGFSYLVEAAQNAHDDERARSLAGRWMKFLEQAAAGAATPAARAVFDSHRVEAALALGQPAAAIPALEASARDFPQDYNPPARLARLYLTAGRVADARAAIERALALAYGPRRRRLEALQKEIEAAALPARPAPRETVKTF